MTDYYAEEARKELERRLHESQVLAEAWGKVERKRTKSGEPCKILSKNYENANFGAPYSATEKRMSVCVRDEQGHYFDDELYLTRTVYNNTEEAEEYKKQGRLIERGAYLHPCIELNCDEIDNEIAERIAYFKRTADSLTQVLDNWEEVAGRVVELRKEAEEFLKAQPACAYYALRNILREQRS